jgi:hypothetical protein
VRLCPGDDANRFSSRPSIRGSIQDRGEELAVLERVLELPLDELGNRNPARLGAAAPQ